MNTNTMHKDTLNTWASAVNAHISQIRTDRAAQPKAARNRARERARREARQLFREYAREMAFTGLDS